MKKNRVKVGDIIRYENRYGVSICALVYELSFTSAKLMILSPYDHRAMAYGINDPTSTDYKDIKVIGHCYKYKTFAFDDEPIVNSTVRKPLKSKKQKAKEKKK